MKKVDIKHLVEKYKKGTSSLEEEAFLITKKTDLNIQDEVLFEYLEKKKVPVPENLNDTLWENFKRKNNKTRKLKTLIFSAVASVALFIAFFLIKPIEQEMSYEEKKALLNEAKAMIANTKKQFISQNIIYEDELIKIYTINE